VNIIRIYLIQKILSFVPFCVWEIPKTLGFRNSMRKTQSNFLFAFRRFVYIDVWILNSQSSESRNPEASPFHISEVGYVRGLGI
jgi:hypothetical protein